jgi:hypothetical protein
MNKLLTGVAMAAIVVLALPAWAQGVTTQGQPTQQNAPGTAGTSKPGVPGLPGSKSGPTVTPSGTPCPRPKPVRAATRAGSRDSPATNPGRRNARLRQGDDGGSLPL